MAGKASGTGQACASCKYQRRKCSADCPLAPYFPPDQLKQFQNAHRLFGVRKILKILEQLNPAQKSEAMKSIMYEANARERYPAHGCMGIIHALHKQIEMAMQERDELVRCLALCQQQQQQEHHGSMVVGQGSSLQMVQPMGGMSVHHGGGGMGYNPSWVVHGGSGGVVNGGGMVYGGGGGGLNEVGQGGGGVEYDVISPFFEGVDDRQSYVDSKGGGHESSSESSLKETQSMEKVSDNELKLFDIN
ncbi:hypothetical protein AMTRI_Chr03g53240 [Amborella trichopoda]|uniref:LOB domain-containing protein n=2 Tax=Amborella trichopoda TaxID=13333 RepID=W1P0T5_AMBTC|nr:LOB domain-containing protein 27 isoform X2 [Amborella trichopoda]ERN01234.1 hypothetical protein AMTR_s00002p00241970 [Amborella trichopoda]|eukprot:XP_006838665.1 LOB domain-containing protein 27 isoform X2 [Amborella trichopoda]